MPLPLLPIILGTVFVGGTVAAVAAKLPRRMLGKPQIMTLDMLDLSLIRASAIKLIKKEGVALAKIGPPRVRSDERFRFLETPPKDVPFYLDINGNPRGLVKYDAAFVSGDLCGVSTAIDVLGEWRMFIPVRKDVAPGSFGGAFGALAEYKVGSDGKCSGYWHPATPTSGEKDIFEQIGAAALEVVVAAVTVYLTATTGVGGAAFALAVAAARNIAKGKPVTKALVDATMSELGSQIQASSYYKAYDSISKSPYTRDAVSAARAEVGANVPAYLRAEKVEAFDQGAAMARGLRTQDIGIAEIKKRFAEYQDDAPRWLQLSLDHGATLEDWIYVYAGSAGLDLMERILTLAASFVESGEPGGVFRPSLMNLGPLSLDLKIAQIQPSRLKVV
jgi:hypothetical protein